LYSYNKSHPLGCIDKMNEKKTTGYRRKEAEFIEKSVPSKYSDT
jgi:hypothetical protein